ncbi:MAG: hypothetical protein AAB460_02565 [Patescibacteria group bacterium]
METPMNDTGLPGPKGQGPAVGIIIVIIVLLVGAFYFFNRLSWTGEEPDLFDATANGTAPVTTSDDADNIDRDLSAQNYDSIDAEMSDVNAELQ